MCKTNFASTEAHGPSYQHVKLSSQKSDSTMESWVGYLGFDHSVLAKIIAYWFYIMECVQIWVFANCKDQ